MIVYASCAHGLFMLTFFVYYTNFLSTEEKIQMAPSQGHTDLQYVSQVLKIHIAQHSRCHCHQPVKHLSVAICLTLRLVEWL